MRQLIVSALFMGILGSTAGYAQECLGDVCVGKTIIDSRDRVGTVSKIEDNEVQYNVNGYSYTSSSSGLSIEVSSLEEIRKGNNVIDSRDRVGSVSNVFKNKKVKYNVNGYNYVSTKVSPQLPEVNGVKIGTIVIDSRDRVGSATNPFKDGRVKYNVNGYNYVSKNVKKEVAAINGLSKNSTAIDSRDRVGTITYLFEDGRARYNVNGYNYTSSGLSPEIGNIGLIKKGNLVIDGRDRVGSASFVFKDGRIRYNVNGYNYTSSDVSPRTDKIGEDQDLFSGVTVIDSRDRVGTITYVFEDSRVRYNVNGYNYTSSNLSPEVKEHSEYKKDTLYSDSGYNVGKPSIFFKDGRIRFSSVAGYNYTRTELFNQVDSLGEITLGSPIVETSGYTGKIELVFENGAVLYEVEKPEIDWQGNESEELKKYKLSAKIFGIDADTLEQDKKSWIDSIASSISNNGNHWGSSSLVIEEAKYEDLKKDLGTLLENNPDMIYDEELREKVQAFLKK